MNRKTLFTLLVLPALLAAPLHAVPEPTGEELDANRVRLERWRKHPAQLARLRRAAQAFAELPEARRTQIVELDCALREETSTVQARLGDTLERYARWLERLPEPDRQRVVAAPDKASRLAVIQELRDGEWMQTQPQALRTHWAQLPVAEQAGFVRTLRKGERQRHHEWQVATRFWKELDAKQPLPARLADLEGSAQTVIKEYLVPLLSKEEKQRLEKAAGHWPAYPTALVAIADRHPFALPGAHGPRRFAELPHAVQKRLTITKTKEPPPRLKHTDGWPELAVAVVEVMLKRKQNALPHELWACNFRSLHPPMQEYVEKILTPVLTEGDSLRLHHADSKWPQYPLAIRELARAHHLPAPPWQTAVPGPREHWDRYRATGTPALPDVPRQVLHDFAAFELSAVERAALKLSPGDTASLRRLREAYFRHNPVELQRLRGTDQKKHDADHNAAPHRP